jgi:hypothetical protein
VIVKGLQVVHGQCRRRRKAAQEFDAARQLAIEPQRQSAGVLLRRLVDAVPLRIMRLADDQPGLEDDRRCGGQSDDQQGKPDRRTPAHARRWVVQAILARRPARRQSMAAAGPGRACPTSWRKDTGIGDASGFRNL